MFTVGFKKSLICILRDNLGNEETVSAQNVRLIRKKQCIPSECIPLHAHVRYANEMSKPDGEKALFCKLSKCMEESGVTRLCPAWKFQVYLARP